jgi:hypothetical protein
VPNEFQIKKTLGAGGKHTTIHLDATKDPAVAAALATDSPFPPGQIDISKVSASATAGKLRLGRVRFTNSASASWGIAVYPDPAKLLAALSPGKNLTAALSFPVDDETSYVLLSWGYDLKGAASGALGLGTLGAVTFGADGQKSGAFGVVRRLPRDTGARTAVTDVINLWKLPKQVKTVRDLDPGTWLIAEINGSVAGNLGVTLGYDYNWVREAKLGGLTGDIGLKIHLGVSAALGFQASGKYALAISRESINAADKLLQLRIFRLSTKGYNFAFNAGATVRGDFSQFLPDKSDDFVKAVFGVQGQQIIHDLQTIEKWVDPKTGLSDALAGFTSEYGQQLITGLTGVNPDAAFTAGVTKLKDFVQKWDDLDQKVASLLWKFVDDKVDLGQIRDLTGKIAAGNQDTIKALIRALLAKVDFPTTLEGQLVEALSGTGVLATLNNSAELRELKGAAQRVHEFLDPNTPAGIFGKLQQFVEDKLNLDDAREVLSQADFDRLDVLLRSKLSAFLDEKLKLKSLDKLRATIALLLDKRQEFYEKAPTALERKYEFSLTASYAKTTTTSALLDVTFDLSQAPGTSVQSMLRQALDGDFKTLLVKQIPGVALREGVLSHGIERQGNVSLSMPFFKKNKSRLNSALGKVTAIEDDGRILLYEGNATDKVTVATRKMQLNSALTIGVEWPHKLGVRQHSSTSLTYAYAFKQATAEMKTSEVDHQLKPYVDSYFPTTFSTTVGATSRPSFDVWLNALDAAIEAKTSNGTGVFGDTLISLDLSVAEGVTASWVNAPGKKSPRYLEMSLRLQERLKHLVLFYYFQARNKYADTNAAEPLLAYAAIPPSNGFSVATLKKNKDVYWNWPSAKAQKAMLSRADTTARLSAHLQRIQDRLLNTDGLQKLAKRYDPTKAPQFLDRVRRNQNNRLAFMRPLLVVENAVVQGAYRAGIAMNAFRTTAAAEPEKAVAELAKFGADVTSTFNRNIGSIFGGAVLRPLGTMLFVEAAAALSRDPAIREATPDAMLSLTVVGEESSYKLADFLKGTLPPKADIVASERITNM